MTTWSAILEDARDVLRPFAIEGGGVVIPIRGTS
jgi:hypothetical protein